MPTTRTRRTPTTATRAGRTPQPISYINTLTGIYDDGDEYIITDKT